jgi:predicted site-specific integrase-resolvase
MDGYAKVKDAARWSGVSVRTFRGWLKDGLPHIRLKTGTILVRYESVGQWLSQFEVKPDNTVDAIVNEIIEELE